MNNVKDPRGWIMLPSIASPTNPSCKEWAGRRAQSIAVFITYTVFAPSGAKRLLRLRVDAADETKVILH